MTSPNMEFPPKSYTSSTVSSMKNVTQKSVGQSQASDMKTMLDQVGVSFVDILFGGFGNVLSAIGAAINNFISSLLIGLRNATGGLVDLTGFLKNTDTKANEAKTEAAVALDKATLADAAAGNAAIVAAEADGKAIQANNAAAAAAELAAQAAGGQDVSNMAYVYNSEKDTVRTQYPATPSYSYIQNAAVAVSGEWYIQLNPAAGSQFPTMPLGPDAVVTPGEKLYMEWRQRRNSANFNARLNLEIRNNAGDIILYDLSPVQPSFAITNGQWITYAGIVTIPAGGTRARPQLKGQYDTSSSPSGQWYFEEMVVRRAITAAQVATADGVPLDSKLVTLTENNNVTNQLATNAANAAQEALLTADIAYENAQYWKDECVVASAGVVLGVNELVIGVVMDVPTGRSRKITDMHFALFNKPGTISISTKVQSAPDPTTGAMTERTVHSFSMIAGSTRFNINNLDIDVYDKERVFWDVTDTNLTTPASVLQVALVGVLL